MEITAVDFLIVFIVFNLTLKIAYPLSGFMHELGHAIPGLILTKGSRIQIRFGQCGNRPVLKLGRFEACVGPTTSFWGSCEFDSQGLSARKLVAIALGGPVISLVLTCLTLWCLFDQTLATWSRFIAAVFFYANCRIFLVAALPRRFRPPVSVDMGGDSDGLKILQLLKDGKTKD